MISLKKRQAGFIIVELLIFSGIQQRARNTDRQSDIKALHSQLEAYYAQNGRYPTLAQFNDAAWRSANMKGLDTDALEDPKGAGPTLVAAPIANAYSYDVDPDNCDNVTPGGVDCAGYILTATYENNVDGATTFVKEDLN
jgi:type II secretory pathway pseudopilin PulG